MWKKNRRTAGCGYSSNGESPEDVPVVTLGAELLFGS